MAVVLNRIDDLADGFRAFNRPLEDWSKLIGDVPSASAILDRFLHRTELIQITGTATAWTNLKKLKQYQSANRSND